MRVLGEQSLGQCLQGVPGEDRVGVAEHGPRGGTVSSGGVPVHHVVVQQSEVVDQLHRGGRPYGRRVLPAERLHRGEHERGPDGLARVPRRRGAVRLLPAEVVQRDPAHRTRQRVDGPAQFGVDPRPRPLQDDRGLLRVGRVRGALPFQGSPAVTSPVRDAGRTPPVGNSGRTLPRLRRHAFTRAIASEGRPTTAPERRPGGCPRRGPAPRGASATGSAARIVTATGRSRRSPGCRGRPARAPRPSSTPSPGRR